jgi:hypothetical protein
MFWGVGVLVILGGLTWLFRQPGSRPVGRAFGVLVLYAVLFLLTLLKIWWTASRSPAVVLSGERLSYQLLHNFRPKSFPIEEVVSCGMRSGTESLRFVRLEDSGRAREFFLNLAVIDGRNEFMHLLGRCLEDRGLEVTGGRAKRWIKPGYEEKFWGLQT